MKLFCILVFKNNCWSWLIQVCLPLSFTCCGACQSCLLKCNSLCLTVELTWNGMWNSLCQYLNEFGQEVENEFHSGRGRFATKPTSQPLLSVKKFIIQYRLNMLYALPILIAYVMCMLIHCTHFNFTEKSSLILSFNRQWNVGFNCLNIAKEEAKIIQFYPPFTSLILYHTYSLYRRILLDSTKRWDWSVHWWQNDILISQALRNWFIKKTSRPNRPNF